MDDALCGLLMDLWNKLSINKIVNGPLNKFKWIKDHLEMTSVYYNMSMSIKCFLFLKKKGTIWNDTDETIKIMNFVTSRKMIRITKFKTKKKYFDWWPNWFENDFITKIFVFFADAKKFQFPFHIWNVLRILI